MGINIVRVKRETTEECQWGVLKGTEITFLDDSISSLQDLLGVGVAKLKAESGSTVALDSCELLSPLSPHSKLICQGLNYRDHRDESGIDEESASEEEITFFAKDSSSLCGPNDNIIRPSNCKLLDYEVELGMVLGKAITEPVDLAVEDVDDYIAGMLICNDVSARDLMFGASFLQWYAGKSYRSFCPAGPILYLLEPGESNKIFNLNLKLWLNGELRQNTNTSLLIHTPEKALTALSRIVDLDVGDCLLTGTPGGIIGQATPEVAMALAGKLFDDKARLNSIIEIERGGVDYLKAGDELRLEIASPDGDVNLGAQTSHIVEESR